MNPDLLSPATQEDGNDNDENLTSFCSNIMHPNIVEYQYMQKCIPFDIPSVIVPKEELCFFCKRKLVLEEYMVLTRFGFEILQ